MGIFKYNVVFLDIDGVLNHQRMPKRDIVPCISPEGQKYGALSKRCIKLLNKLLTYELTRIVVSSSWRNDEFDVIQTLYTAGVRENSIIGVTPSLRDGPYILRGNEIYGWCQQNSDKINTYVILDDDSDMLYWQRNHFQLVDNCVGLTENVVYKAELILKNTRYMK